MGYKIEESYNEIFNMVRSFCEMVIQRKQAADISTYTPEPSRHFNFTCDDHDGDEEYSIPLKDMPQFSPFIALAPVSSIMEPKDSLIMRNEELSTILEKELDELIKSNVEDLISIPSESEDSSGSDSENVLPSCEDFSPISIFKEKSVTFSNPLFDSDDDFTSSDNEHIVEDVPERTMVTTFNSNTSILRILTTENILYIVSILEGFTDEPPLEENDDLFDLESKENDWKKILYDAPIDDLITEDKVFDPGIHEKSFSLTFVKLTFEDRHYFPITFVIRIFLPYLTYSVDSSFLLSSGSEDTIFDPGISAFHFSSLKPVAYENLMVIFPFLCFCPKDKGIRGESSWRLAQKQALLERQPVIP
ncbi:hypothetical protein Tco_0830024 [Tanacetum coccineum]